MVIPLRKPWLGGNWKCNGTKSSISNLVKILDSIEFDKNKLDVVVFPSPIHVLYTQSILKPDFFVGSQNVSKTLNGAYTGETSALMLKDAEISWTLIGHSERRQYYGETDQDVATKLGLCQKEGLYAVVCIGEHLEQRKRGETKEVLLEQVKAILSNIEDWSRIVLAYEPVWAIGTGVVATSEQVADAHAFIRRVVQENVNESVAHSVRIVYGGSVNEKNCQGLARLDGIDGFLVGGASLKPEFKEIVTSLL